MMTTILGRPPARVVADVGPHHGVYNIALDEPPSRRDRAVRAATSAYAYLIDEAVQLMGLVTPPAPNEQERGSAIELQHRFGLTRMESRVATRLTDGLAVNEIAAALGIGVATVRTHLKRAYAKTGARGQADLVRLVLTGERRRA